MTDIVKLYIGDKKAETLLDAVLDTVYERGDGMPIPTILGVLDLVKIHIINTETEK
jgi:hypothetical protein